jgi:hypothetical protein
MSSREYMSSLHCSRSLLPERLETTLDARDESLDCSSIRLVHRSVPVIEEWIENGVEHPECSLVRRLTVCWGGIG